MLEDVSNNIQFNVNTQLLKLDRSLYKYGSLKAYKLKEILLFFASFNTFEMILFSINLLLFSYEIIWLNDKKNVTRRKAKTMSKKLDIWLQ